MGESKIKTASRYSFSTSHLIVILFHFTIACLLIFNRSIFKGKNIRTKIFWLGIILGIASVLAVLAVYIYYRHNVMYVINNENL